MVLGVGVPVIAFNEISGNTSKKNSPVSSSPGGSAITALPSSLSTTFIRKSLGTRQTWPQVHLESHE
jgi:hypothetical protein